MSVAQFAMTAAPVARMERSAIRENFIHGYKAPHFASLRSGMIRKALKHRSNDILRQGCPAWCLIQNGAGSSL